MPRVRRSGSIAAIPLQHEAVKMAPLLTRTDFGAEAPVDRWSERGRGFALTGRSGHRLCRCSLKCRRWPTAGPSHPPGSRSSGCALTWV
jgi:hypothetical protein